MVSVLAGHQSSQRNSSSLLNKRPCLKDLIRWKTIEDNPLASTSMYKCVYPPCAHTLHTRNHSHTHSLSLAHVRAHTHTNIKKDKKYWNYFWIENNFQNLPVQMARETRSFQNYKMTPKSGFSKALGHKFEQISRHLGPWRLAPEGTLNNNKC